MVYGFELRNTSFGMRVTGNWSKERGGIAQRGSYRSMASTGCTRGLRVTGCGDSLLDPGYSMQIDVAC